MRQFTIICDFPQGQQGGHNFYIGSPAPDFNHVYHQNKLLSNTHNGSVNSKALECLTEVHQLATKLDISTPNLLIYLLGINTN